MEGAEGDFKFSLLRKFNKPIHYRDNNNEEGGGEEEEVEEIELSLGLSMNGRFGVDPARKKLKRSNSISNLVFTLGAGAGDKGGCNNHARVVAFESYAPLVRTQSLPVETEEEWRRRKEMQSVKRMEARKKRMEKLKNKDHLNHNHSSKDNGCCFEDVKKIGNGNGLHGNIRRVDSGVVANGFESGNGNGNVVGMPSSESSSNGSQRSGSSGSPDLQNHQMEGAKQSTTAKSPSSLPSLQEPREKEPAQDRNKKPPMVARTGSLKNAMFDMPYVTMKESGPSGSKVEGFLYRYKNGEEVKIVCVCHGMFLSPAEFVKHGGGGDVEQPLKHIVVNPFPLL